MTPARWPCPLPGGGTSDEFALSFDRSRRARLLIVPALFDEGNKLRRFTVDLMRRLDAAGIDSVLPDLPGCNESLLPLQAQDPTDWLDAMTAAARHFRATHALGIRGGCLFVPQGLSAFHYAPVRAAAILRQMLRARILSSREAGREESRDALAQAAVTQGITLAGYDLGADFYRHFEAMAPQPVTGVLTQEEIGGSGLWLRAEPSHDPAQSEVLCAVLASRIDA